MRSEGDKEFNCHDYLGETVFHSLLETVMGVSKSSQGPSGYDYVLAVLRMCDILHLRHTRFWLRSDLIFNFTKHGKNQAKMLNLIHSLSKNVIHRKKMDYDAGKRNFIETTDNKDAKVTSVNGLSFGQSAGLRDDLDVDDNDIAEKKRLPFLDRLMEASQKENILTEQEISDQVNTIMFEGHDTIVVASSFFLSMMGCHPDVQENVIRELDEIFGDNDRPCSFQDTLEMKYLEQCLMETLRLYPPVPFIGRNVNTDLKLASGDYTVPAGSSIIVDTIMIHRSPKLYPNPTTFDPDNFLPEKTRNRHYYAFIPFSAGPRSCVGRKYAILKLKILLSTIMRNFRVRSNIKECDFKLQGDIILKRTEGFKVILESRK
ncbi:cytochrome P450 4g15-like [Cotesia glomerata]|uniref:cytochrome P450 4g15-like n=1 Tax=Cotesia glomerata TaxID=32391 RepID=UPI001D01C356|nr:cytochrome P450 4g15-like [Cotesia glomerata]